MQYVASPKTGSVSKETRSFKKIVFALLSLIAIAAIPQFFPSSYWMQLINQALIYCILVVGLNFITGFTGQINFGQAAFFGIGAYTTALMTTAGHSFWLALPCSGIMAGGCRIFFRFATFSFRQYFIPI